LNLLGFIPCLGAVFTLAGWIWSLVAMVIAIRQRLDVDTTSAIVTAVIGWIVIVAIYIVIFVIFGGIFALGSILTG
jgi:hypothetical protein